jgi:hypothetical protein
MITDKQGEMGFGKKGPEYIIIGEKGSEYILTVNVL